MVKYIACYDIKASISPHSEFLDQAEQVGWSRWIWGPKANKWLRLPNTTLLGEFANSDEARAALDKALAATKAELGVPIQMTKHLIGTFSATNYASDEQVE